MGLEGFDGARVYFSPCGIGLGHASRNIPIAQELRSRGASILFSSYLEGVDYARRQGFSVVSVPPISLSNDSSGRIDLKMSSVQQGVSAFPTFAGQVNAELKYMKAFKPDVVVSDSRLSSIFAAQLLDIPQVLILNQFTPLVPLKKMFVVNKILDGIIMTLIGRGWGYADKILIPDFPAPYTLSIDCLRIPGPYQKLVELIGAILPLRQEDAEDKRLVREELGIERGQRLIYAGISGPRAERIPLLKLLEPIFENFPEEYRVVMSMGNPNSGSKPIHKGPLIELGWAENKFDILNACDLVISRGGHETLMQSICYSKPSIIIPVPNHPEQYGNARRAQGLGVANAIHQKSLNGEMLPLLVEEMLGDPSYGEQFAKLNAKRLGDGVKRSVDAIASVMRR
jgi:UDP:flavonoid glycosyltransferase YjiC (YdhE family)